MIRNSLRLEYSIYGNMEGHGKIPEHVITDKNLAGKLHSAFNQRGVRIPGNLEHLFFQGLVQYDVSSRNPLINHAVVHAPSYENLERLTKKLNLKYDKSKVFSD
jgi:hypothetical protein